jgi:para-aminobenzoate synthetase/4-amino-4-deoxychorismate lyase
VAIRTVTIRGATAEYGIGGGITFDSAAEAEVSEAYLKSDVLTTRQPEFSLVETLYWDPSSGYRHLDGHLQRLQASARYFDFNYDDPSVQEALAAVHGATPLRVRLALAADGKIIVGSDPLDDVADCPLVALDSVPVDSRNRFLYHKTDLRQVYEQARARHPSFDDVILINERGEVTETTIANLAVRLGGVWLTPPLESGCLPGVYRRILVDGGRLVERPVTTDELGRAEAVALVSSVRGWRPARLSLVPHELRHQRQQPDDAEDQQELLHETILRP